MQIRDKRAQTGISCLSLCTSETAEFSNRGAISNTNLEIFAEIGAETSVSSSSKKLANHFLPD